jgi:Tfp pilus assembly protein PilV
MRKKIIKNRGFLAVEILVAVSIIAVSILAAMAVSQKSIYVSRQAFHMTQAGFLLEEGAEAIRIFRDDNTWANFTTIFNTSSTYYIPATISSWTASLPTTSSGNLIDNFFTRTVTLANVNRNSTTQDISSTGTNDPGTKLVTITVSWPEGGKTITKTLQFYITNIFS